VPNRYTRDQLIIKAITMSQAGNVERHDCPDGVVLPDAYSIGWMQDILDWWYHMFPFSSTVTKVSLNCTANSDSITLPSDFILDVRNGYHVQRTPGDNLSFQKVFRIPLQKFINRQLYYQGASNIKFPSYYNIQGRIMKIVPTPIISTVGQLWYYKLPTVLGTDDIPDFPNDYVIVEYLRIRALEFVRVHDPGTAQKFCDKIVGSMKAAGLMNEPEDDEIPFDDLVNRPSPGHLNTYSWMGQR